VSSARTFVKSVPSSTSSFDHNLEGCGMDGAIPRAEPTAPMALGPTARI
jgi:hypothetical protein